MSNRVLILTSKLGPLPYSAALGLLRDGFDVTIFVITKNKSSVSLLKVLADYGARYLINRVAYLALRLWWIKFNKKNFFCIPVKTFDINDWHDVLQEISRQDPAVILTASCALKIPVEQFAPDYHLLNLHPAPLPLWRGADPIFWMSILKQKQLGFSIHKLAEKIDKGDLYCVEPIDVRTFDLWGRGELSIAEVVKEKIGAIVKGILEKSIAPKPQSNGRWWPLPSKRNRHLALDGCAYPIKNND